MFGQKWFWVLLDPIDLGGIWEVCNFSLTFIQLSDPFFLEVLHGWFRGWTVAQPCSKSELPKLLTHLFWKKSWILKLLNQLILSAFPLGAWHTFCKHTLSSPSFEPHLEADLLSSSLPIFLLGTSSIDFVSGVWEGTMFFMKPQAGWDSYPVRSTD